MMMKCRVRDLSVKFGHVAFGTFIFCCSHAFWQWLSARLIVMAVQADRAVMSSHVFGRWRIVRVVACDACQCLCLLVTLTLV